MKRRPRTKADPIEQRIEMALRAGEFIHDRACFSFVNGLEDVVASIRNVIATEPARGVALCETFLAGCHGKADELDDERQLWTVCAGSHLPLDQSLSGLRRRCGSDGFQASCVDG